MPDTGSEQGMMGLKIVKFANSQRPESKWFFSSATNQIACGAAGERLALQQAYRTQLESH